MTREVDRRSRRATSRGASNSELEFSILLESVSVPAALIPGREVREVREVREKSTDLFQESTPVFHQSIKLLFGEV